jgi:hypothetical protein
MRRLICLLLVVSLSWVTTGYACRMDEVVRAVCCCPHEHADHDSKTADPEAAGMSGKARCCDIVSGAALDSEQPGVLPQVGTLDLPVVALLPATPWTFVETVQNRSDTHPPARAPPRGSGTLTYLTTARLRL